MKTKGESIDQVLPGEIFVSNFQITIMLEENSASAWKKAIKLDYKNAIIIGSQKTTTNINMKVGKILRSATVKQTPIAGSEGHRNPPCSVLEPSV